MLRVELRLVDRAEWVKLFDPHDSTLFIKDANPPRVGQEIRVDLFAGDDGPHIILRGNVIARRIRGDGTLPPGFNVALGPYEREKVNYLNGFVRGGFINLRETRRLPIRLRVDYGDTGGPRTSHTRDINEQGIFVITETPLPEESEVNLIIHVPDFPQPLSVTAKVSHTVLVEDEDVPGMGLRFMFEAGQADTFTAVIDNLEKRVLEGDRPEDCLM